MSKKLVAQEVNDFITKRRPAVVCDLCIVRGIGLSVRAHANQITAALATTSEFVREKGSCPDCKQTDVMVIKAVDPKSAANFSVLNFESIIVELGKVTVKIVR
ncbi:hypothetical protein [Bradyrhizobium retamae]|uniref:Uncharacterized protein n=1 Tax=Bradyrhizobium retamae TaxID=1300035 RepID=A0A0R3MTS5_9BRAD|nr:hypothetical protein [Bradyrhizobium retamae]KRR23265.1 hypothetical protein CQ13_27650 [Bradyrhizobium retamae]